MKIGDAYATVHRTWLSASGFVTRRADEQVDAKLPHWPAPDGRRSASVDARLRKLDLDLPPCIFLVARTAMKGVVRSSQLCGG